MQAAHDSNNPSREEIATFAYRLWEEKGRPQGTDMDHWLEAEKTLRQKRSATATAQQATSAASSQASSTKPARRT